MARFNLWLLLEKSSQMSCLSYRMRRIQTEYFFKEKRIITELWMQPWQQIKGRNN